ncbi:MAG: hypothetical protein H0W68_13855, partial [Gemmatimonadaceae bacterium]|nr:hypothetical protein [Gemmatimonadaceae bacterium]
MTQIRATFALIAVLSLPVAGRAQVTSSAKFASGETLQASGISAALPGQLDSIMTAAIANHASPGITIAIGRHGRVVYTHGWGPTD